MTARMLGRDRCPRCSCQPVGVGSFQDRFALDAAREAHLDDMSEGQAKEYMRDLLDEVRVLVERLDRRLAYVG